MHTETRIHSGNHFFNMALLLGLISLSAQAANWPSWRGPDGNLTTPEKAFPLQWDAKKNVRWRVPLPDRGNSSPIVWGNKVFITQATDTDKRRTVMCFDRNNGSLLWQSGITYTEKEATHGDNPYCAASPVTDGERVIATFGSAGVYGYDFKGKELWHRDLGKQIHQWGYASSPILFQNLCILYHGPGTNSALYAFNKKTGKTVWEVSLPEPVPTERFDGFAGKGPGVVGTWSTPHVIKVKGRNELILSLADKVRAFDPATGKDLWECSGLNPLIYTSSIYGDGLVVAMGGYFGGTLAVKPGGSGDVTQTHRVWHEQRAKKHRIGTGVIKDGHIYLVNTIGVAECMELATGKTVWEERLKGPGANAEMWASVILVRDKFYAINKSGDVFVMRAAPNFELIATNILGETTNATPAFSNGEIFWRTDKSLWCVSEIRTTAWRDVNGLVE